MASGDSDHIEVMDSTVAKRSEISSGVLGSDDEDRDDREKNVPYDPAVGPSGAIGKVHKSDRKIGHRRVGEGGEITYKKIQSSQIMGSIQLGIQHAIGGLASKPERDLLMQDFMTVETTNFPHEGSNHTPAHHYSEFKFKTYAPIAFRYFRDLFGIQPDDFLMSMCSAPLRELSNPGASGSIFYLTNDDEFIIKTVQHKEGEFLQKLLPGYYLNLDQNPRTLLPKFFGLYCYCCNSKNVRLVAMNNLLPSSVKLHQKYDLKGSTYKRKANKQERQKRSPTYKDLDFMEHHPEGIFLEADTYSALIKTMQRDCRVLESFKIMDYSLLVGIHNLDEAQREKSEARKRADSDDEAEGEPRRSGLNRTRSEQGKEDFGAQVKRTQSINRQRLVAHSTAMESIQAESEPIDEEEDVPPGGIPARNARGERLLLFLGIIDILQSYRLRKKLEHTWKSMIHDGDTVSVHRPSFYAQRFLDFMGKTVFKKIPSSLKHSPSKRKSISKPMRPQEDIDTSATASSSGASGVKAVSLSDVTAHITPTSLTSPVSTAPAVKMTQVSAKTSLEPDVAFPAVLKGSQKQRVPPPVPPRGSPKPKRGGGSQPSSLDTKGDYLNISVNDIPPQTPITSSDDDFWFHEHDFKYKEPVACRMQPSISDHSVKIDKLVASNNFLDYVEEGESITERSHPSKGLYAQSNMMSKFNIDNMVRQHLDTGNYDDTSLTESSSEEESKPIYKKKKTVGRRSTSPMSDESFVSARRSTSPVIRSKSPRPSDKFREDFVSARRSTSPRMRPLSPRPTDTLKAQNIYAPSSHLNIPSLSNPAIGRGPPPNRPPNLPMIGPPIKRPLPPVIAINSSLSSPAIARGMSPVIPIVPSVSSPVIRSIAIIPAGSIRMGRPNVPGRRPSQAASFQQTFKEDLYAPSRLKKSPTTRNLAGDFRAQETYVPGRLVKSPGSMNLQGEFQKPYIPSTRPIPSSRGEFNEPYGPRRQISSNSRSISPKDDEFKKPYTEKTSVHNVRASDLLMAAKSLRKIPQKGYKMDQKEKSIDSVVASNKPESKPMAGLMSNLTKRLNFNQSKRNKPKTEYKTVIQTVKTKPKIEIRPYTEEHSKGNAEDESIFHKKAKTKIDMFQKQIYNEAHTDNSSLSSFEAEGSRRSPRIPIKQAKVMQTKKIFESAQRYGGPTKPNIAFSTYSPTSQAIRGNVHEKIKKFSAPAVPQMRTPMKVPRRKKKGSFKRRSDRRKIYEMKIEIEEAL